MKPCQRALGPSLVLFVLIAAIAVGPARGQETEAPAPPPPATEETKAQAKERRIEEYLRKKEERRARREQRDVDPASVEQAVDQALDRGTARRPAASRRSPLPRGLAAAQANVRASHLAHDPTVQAYLDLIDRQEASAYQLAAFGNFLGQNGLARDAREYYDVALFLEPHDTLLWLNAGTLHRQMGDAGAAQAAYRRSLHEDPNNALAHYNLGAALDEQGEYEEALEEYKVALTLDPTLGDPAYNPQAANNERLLAVKLMLYREQSGSLGLPLIELPTEPAPPGQP